MICWKVSHKYKLADHIERKDIGIYSSKENAETAIASLKNQNGFKDTVDGFRITKAFTLFKPRLLDKTFWADGFDTYTYAENEWYENIVVVFIGIIFSPLILFFLLAFFLQNVFTAPFEYRKYKRSKYYEVYKKKYKIGITREFCYLLHNKLLTFDIRMEEIEKSDGRMCLVNNDFCFDLCDIVDLKSNDGDIQIQLSENGMFFPLNTFIENEKTHFNEERINRRFIILIWREDEDEYADVLSNELNTSLLQIKEIYFHVNEDELANIIKEFIQTKDKTNPNLTNDRTV